MGVADQNYYEQKELWGNFRLSGLEKDRVLGTIALIPEGIKSILEVGCGDGLITNRLVTIYPEVIGVDLSSEALKHVAAKTILAGADRIPLPDCSQDLVLLAEVIEHLPVGIYENCLQEAARIARDYLIVTVPYREYLPQRFIRCFQCGCIYHRYRHVRSFDLKKIKHLFPSFSLVKIGFLGGKTVRPYSWEIFIRQNLAGHYNPYPLAVCPQCGQKGSKPPPRGLLSFLLAVIGRIIPRKKRYHWLGIVYKRKKANKEGEEIGLDQVWFSGLWASCT